MTRAKSGAHTRSAEERAILDLLAERADDATICPSEAARRLDPDSWRERMNAVRAAAVHLEERGLLVIKQHGEVLPRGAALVGPIRLGKI